MLVLRSKVLMFVVNLILIIWQLPQTILGLIALAIFGKHVCYYNECAKVKVIRVDKRDFLGNACCSFGPIILTTTNCDENTLRHETGHSVQSIYYGPLFLLIVGLPSIILFWRKRLQNKSSSWYYEHFPENQAEKLGHTKRITL